MERAAQDYKQTEKCRTELGGSSQIAKFQGIEEAIHYIAKSLTCINKFAQTISYRQLLTVCEMAPMA